MRVRTPVFLQNEAAECGATALQIVLAYYGCFVESAEIRAACGVSRDGVRGDHLVSAARTYGMEARGFRKKSASLKDLTPPFIAFMAFNHFLVIEGFTPGSV
jgi:ATP-binding cassette, subfamily C, bacterial